MKSAGIRKEVEKISKEKNLAIHCIFYTFTHDGCDDGHGVDGIFPFLHCGI